MVQHTYKWTGASGTSLFGTSTNWIDTATNQPGSVPGSADIVDFTGAEIVTGTGNIDILNTNGVGYFGFVLEGSVYAAGGANLTGINFIYDGGKLATGGSSGVQIGANGTAGAVAVTAGSTLAASNAGG